MLTAVIRKGPQDAPEAPQSLKTGQNAITLDAQTGYGETWYGYSTNPSATAADIQNWQTGTTFTGLKSGTDYYPLA